MLNKTNTNIENPISFANYYKISCIDSNTYTKKPPETIISKERNNKYSAVLLSKEEIEKGCLNKDNLELFVKHLDKDKLSDSFSVVVQCESIMRYEDRAYKTKKSEDVEFCTICAVGEISKDGQIYFPEGSDHPEIPRELLGPIEGMFFALVNEHDKYIVSHSDDFKKQLNFAEFLEKSEKMYNALLDKRVSANKYSKSGKIYIKLADIPAGTTFQIVNNYLRIEDNKNKINLELFNNLVCPKMPSKSAALPYETMSDRYGNMGDKHPLAKAQRIALGATMSLKNGQTQALNGPPGTGKTTFLQSVVANLFTKAALEDKKAPIIIGASTNNQAVTNIIESFNSIEIKENNFINSKCKNLRQRWLPNSDSVGFGLFLPSGTKKDETTYLTDSKLKELLFNQENGLGCKEFFTIKVKESFNKPDIVSFDDALSFLKTELKKSNENLSKLTGLSNKIYTFNSETLVDIEKTLDIDESQKLEALNYLSRLEQTKTAWDEIIRSEPLSRKLLFFTSSTKTKRNDLVNILLQDINDIDLNNPKWDNLSLLLTLKIQEAKKKINDISGSVKERTDLLESWKKETAIYALNNKAYCTSITDLDESLDLNLRNYMFWLAVHIFEARWIKAMDDSYWSSDQLKRSRATNPYTGKSIQLGLYAMLTPCLVSTLHNLPKAFSEKDENNKYNSLFNFADLLIVDEAGQVTPEIGAQAFALAKKSIVVGDVYQIEPVWSVPKLIDKANASKYLFKESNIKDEKWNALQDSFRASSSGNLMSMAQLATAYSSEGMSSPGLWLLDHHRCVDPIIQYCNELCYGGKLVSKRSDNKEFREKLMLPPLGWAFVPGKSQMAGSSRVNKFEAKVIVEWLVQNKDRLEKIYEKEIHEIVGVVTPFKAQSDLIKNTINLLKKRLSLSGEITVGTVHSLQGAERPIILFSSVYTIHDKTSNYFFNRGPNMLNVAVSRTKDSFILFGDINILENQKGSPSALLAKHLFSKDSNEILIDAAWVKRDDLIDPSNADSVLNINTLEGHREQLRKAFEDANNELIIVSPWITDNAISVDKVENMIKEVVNRGVKCRIYYDKTKIKPNNLIAIDKLAKSGAETIALKNTHAKNIFVDDEYMISGSFNWLSANRNDLRYIQIETSMRYISPKVKEEKKVIIAQLEKNKV